MAIDKKYILSTDVISKKLERLALEILENNLEEKELVLVGIANNGLVIAHKIKQIIEKWSSITVALISITMNKKYPEEITLSETMNFDDKSIVLIDDVTNSGRVLLYALKPFLAFYPKKIQTLVLVERTHTQFPISADYKGIALATTLHEHIVVEVEQEEIVGAYLT